MTRVVKMKAFSSSSTFRVLFCLPPPLRGSRRSSAQSRRRRGGEKAKIWRKKKVSVTTLIVSLQSTGRIIERNILLGNVHKKIRRKMGRNSPDWPPFLLINWKPKSHFIQNFNVWCNGMFVFHSSAMNEARSIPESGIRRWKRAQMATCSAIRFESNYFTFHGWLH